MRDGEPNMWAGLATLRSGYTQMQWQRVQILVVFNTIALPLVFGSGQTESVKSAVALAGFLLHVAFIAAATRADNWMKFWEQKMSELEKLDQEKENQSGSRVQIFCSQEFRQIRTSRSATRRVLWPLGTILVFLWLEEGLRHGYFAFVVP